MVSSMDHVIVVSSHGMRNTITDSWSILNNASIRIYTIGYYITKISNDIFLQPTEQRLLIHIPMLLILGMFRIITRSQ